jgi:ABC-type nitrate/sulfonate/bicarbonate transport system substrate-binding protein
VKRASFVGTLAAAVVTNSKAVAAPETERLRFGAAGSESFDESFYLLDGGFLAKAGLSGDVEVLPNGPRIMDAIVGGSLDIGMSDIVQLANAVNRGLPLRFFAGGCLYQTDAPTTVLCVAKDSPIRSPKDLEGKTVSLQGVKTLAEISTREWLKQHGADPSRVSFIEVGPSLAVPTLLRGTVAAAIVSEPFITSAGDQIVRFGKPYDAVAKSFYISSWYAKRDWIARNDAAVKGLTNAIYAAARWTNAHHDASAPILAKRLKLDPASFSHMTRATFATTLDPKLMQPVLDIGLKYGLLDGAVDATTLTT